MRILFAALLILLSGCLTSDDTDPLETTNDPDVAGPTQETSFEPLVFTGTVSGPADCASYGIAGVEPVTPETVALPPEAGGRVYSLKLTSSATAPNVGATCMLFSDGTLKDGSQIDRGTVPAGATSVQIITNANVDLQYKLTIK